jgi:hypothetical protein
VFSKSEKLLGWVDLGDSNEKESIVENEALNIIVSQSQDEIDDGGSDELCNSIVPDLSLVQESQNTLVDSTFNYFV